MPHAHNTACRSHERMAETVTLRCYGYAAIWPAQHPNQLINIKMMCGRSGHIWFKAIMADLHFLATNFRPQFCAVLLRRDLGCQMSQEYPASQKQISDLKHLQYAFQSFATRNIIHFTIHISLPQSLLYVLKTEMFLYVSRTHTLSAVTLSLYIFQQFIWFVRILSALKQSLL